MLSNVLIVVTVLASPSSGSPMYFFLAYLSFTDVVYSTVFLPKLFTSLLSDRQTISFLACIGQLFIGHLFGGAEVSLLMVMALDCYVVVFKPLHYFTIMDRQVCILLQMVVWARSFVHSMLQLVFVSSLPCVALM